MMKKYVVDMKKLKISLAMLAYNETTKLKECLEKIKDHVNEIVIVLDKNSPRKTYLIAKKYADKLYTEDFVNFSQMRNKAIEYCNNEWILSLDPDEYLEEPEKLLELIELAEWNDCDAIVFPRRNYEYDIHNQNKPNILAKYPDHQIRLFKRYCRWRGQVHERLFGYKNAVITNSHIIHYKLDVPIAEYLRKRKLYKRLGEIEPGVLEE